MFSYVSGDKHIEIKTPTHQIRTESHGAREKKSDDKMFFCPRGKDAGCRGGVFGGGGLYDKTVETQKECV